LEGWTCCTCWVVASPLAQRLFQEKKVVKGVAEVVEVVEVAEAPDVTEDAKDVTLQDLSKEILELKGLVRLSQMSSVPSAVQSSPVDARSVETIRLIVREELHVTSDMMAVQIGDKVNQAITTKTKGWSAALEKKSTVVVDKEAMEEIVTSATDHSVKSNEMKASDTDHQRQRRRRNVVIKKVAESTDKDPKKRMAYDMKFITEVLGMGDEILTCFRAGAKREVPDPDKPRPLIVSFKTVDDAEYWSYNGEGLRVENPKDKKEPHWINRDLCAADAEAGFRARKAAQLKRKERREAEKQQ